jgi:TPR repeat protein
MLPVRFSSKIFDLPKSSERFSKSSTVGKSQQFGSKSFTSFVPKQMTVIIPIRSFAKKAKENPPKSKPKTKPVETAPPAKSYSPAEGMYLEAMAEQQTENFDEMKAVKLLTQSMELGYVGSKIALAKLFITSTNPEIMNPKKGFEILQELVDKDQNPEAILCLGVCYLEGEGVPQDKAQGIKLVEQAAKLGNAEALTNLGVLYMNGDGVESDPKKAVEYFTKAVKNSEKAQFNLAMCYEHGLGVEANEQKAFELFLPLADKEEPLSMSTVGYYYMQGLGVEQNPKKALHYLRKAAQAELPDALCNMGICYLTGFGVKIDPNEARIYFSRASAQEYPEGDYNLGQMYLTGDGVELSEKKGIELLERASSKGFAEASYALGRCAELGVGIPKNSTEALKYFELATTQQHLEAPAKIGDLLIETDPSKALMFYQESAKAGSCLGNLGVASCYEGGVGGLKADTKKAKQFVTQALEAGLLDNFPDYSDHPLVKKYAPQQQQQQQ